MPKVIVSNKKGLYQIDGSGMEIKNILTIKQGGGFRLPIATIEDGVITNLTNNDSGGVKLFSGASVTTINLPAGSDVSPGWNIRLILTATALNDVSIQGTAGEIVGQTLCVVTTTGLNSSSASATTVVFKANLKAGSYLDVFSDGTKFYVSGVGGGSVTNQFTIS